jgi:hypothetical protein
MGRFFHLPQEGMKFSETLNFQKAQTSTVASRRVTYLESKKIDLSVHVLIS